MLHRVFSGDADAHGSAEWLVSFDATPLYTNNLPQSMKGIGTDKVAQIWYLATEFESKSNFCGAARTGGQLQRVQERHILVAAMQGQLVRLFLRSDRRQRLGKLVLHRHRRGNLHHATIHHPVIAHI